MAKDKVPTPNLPSLVFGTNEDSLTSNTKLLESHGFNLDLLMISQAGLTVWHGSEFCHRDALTRVLRSHPMLGYLIHLFEHGMLYLLT